MSDDFDGLLDDPTPRRKVGRPTNAERAARAEESLKSAALQAEIRRAGSGVTKIAEEEFLMPVSQNFLARVLRMDPATVKQRLRDGGCKPAGMVGAGRPVYLFHEALPYLIKPKMDIGTYIKTLNAADLPNSINKVFWEAERIKNKTLIETGEAWPTGRVLDVLGTVFMLIKDRVPLLTETMRESGISDAQLTLLNNMTDQFQSDLYDALVELPKQRQTYSRIVDIDPGDEQAVEE